MHTKSQVSTVFKQFKMFSKNQTRYKICAIQIDNAMEFVCLNQFLIEHGIRH